MRRLLHDGIATRRGVMAIHEEPRVPRFGARISRTPKRRRATC